MVSESGERRTASLKMQRSIPKGRVGRVPEGQDSVSKDDSVIDDVRCVLWEKSENVAAEDHVIVLDPIIKTTGKEDSCSKRKTRDVQVHNCIAINVETAGDAVHVAGGGDDGIDSVD